MTDAASEAVVKAVAERFGLVEAERDGALSVLFIGDKANEVTFKEVLGYLLVDCKVTHQFAAPHIDLPGVSVRGLLLPDTNTSIFLVVVGDPAAEEYVTMPPAMRQA